VFNYYYRGEFCGASKLRDPEAFGVTFLLKPNSIISPRKYSPKNELKHLLKVANLKRYTFMYKTFLNRRNNEKNNNCSIGSNIDHFTFL